MSKITWLKNPNQTQPTLLVAFTGWNDAGDAASSALNWLTKRCKAKLLATLDPEPFYDFSETRPLIHLNKDGSRYLSWPNNNLIAATLICKIPQADKPHNLSYTDLAILVGTEPQFKWRTYTQEIITMARRINSPLIITLGSLLADIPHTRPSVIYGSSPDAKLAEQLSLPRSSYEGPTGIVGVLNSACVEAGLQTASLWAAVPGYASEVPSPKASLGLIENLCRILDITPNTAELKKLAKNYEKRVSNLIPQSDDTAEYLATLEANYDEAVAENKNLEQMRTADPSTLVTQIEDFLREQGD